MKLMIIILTILLSIFDSTFKEKTEIRVKENRKTFEEAYVKRINRLQTMPTDAVLTTVSAKRVTVGYYEYPIGDPANSFLNMFRKYKVIKKLRQPP